MNMMRVGCPPVIAVAFAVLLTVGPADAMRRAARIPDRQESEAPDWVAGAACEVLYHNTCTGWTWIWSNWQPRPGTWNARDRVGVVVDACCETPRLASTWTYFLSSAPFSYAYTSLSVRVVDGSDCPSGLPIAEHYRAPVTGWNLDVWEVPVPSRFAVVQELRTWYGHYTLNTVTTDHPAAAGGDPPACGTCYPATRETHSWYWGTPTEPLCPGVPFFDGTCNAELMVTANLDCVVGLEAESWGRLKSLYR